MISAKFDEVSKNAIWTEHCVREAKTLRLNEAFGGIRSPSKMVILAEKPNRIVPRSEATSADVQHAQQHLKDLCIIKDEDATPEQRFVLPITGNQEYGFFHTPLVQKDALFHHPKNMCDVCKYSDAYYTMTGKSPYANKSPT